MKLCTPSEIVCSYVLCLVAEKRKHRKSLKIPSKEAELEVEKKWVSIWKEIA